MNVQRNIIHADTCQYSSRAQSMSAPALQIMAQASFQAPGSRPHHRADSLTGRQGKLSLQVRKRGPGGISPKALKYKIVPRVALGFCDRIRLAGCVLVACGIFRVAPSGPALRSLSSDTHPRSRPPALGQMANAPAHMHSRNAQLQSPISTHGSTSRHSKTSRVCTVTPRGPGAPPRWPVA